MVTVLDEVPVQIPQRHLEGLLFLAYVALFPFIALELFITIEILNWIITISWCFLFMYILAKIWDRQVKAGPARGWFRRGMIDAWVSVDGEELVVRRNKVESYKPSLLVWKTTRSFSVKEKDTDFELVFQTPDGARSFASKLRASKPRIVETNLQ